MTSFRIVPRRIDPTVSATSDCFIKDNPFSLDDVVKSQTMERHVVVNLHVAVLYFPRGNYSVVALHMLVTS